VERPIGDVARATGLTSRTLRHYDAIGLLAPTRVGADGRRWYDDAALVRLQRILLLRDLGLALAEIGAVLGRQDDEVTALRTHLEALHAERARLARQIRSVERTIAARAEGKAIMAQDAFDGFDHTQHRDEVEQRWGTPAYATSDTWWRGLGAQGQATFRATSATLAADWAAAAADGVEPSSDRAQHLARRHAQWLAAIPGTPGAGADEAPSDYLLGLAEMYVVDERFAAAYGGVAGAAFVRDALRELVARRD